MLYTFFFSLIQESYEPIGTSLFYIPVARYVLLPFRSEQSQAMGSTALISKTTRYLPPLPSSNGIRTPRHPTVAQKIWQDHKLAAVLRFPTAK